MDPITLIITALSGAASNAVLSTAVAGAANSVSQGVCQAFAQGGAQDAYNTLKDLINRKFAGQPKAQMVLEEYETDPETYEVPLKKKLAEAGADKDEEIIQAAEKLLEQLQPEESATTSKYKVEFQAEVKGAQVGDGNTQQNTFN